MFALQNRGELDPVTERELENLISRLRRFLLTAHNEQGQHRVDGEVGVTYEGAVTNIKVVNGIVVEVS